MHYFLTPLHTHIDFGFGATGDAFKNAADTLEAALPERGGVFNEQLPINYLRGHAVELFLKSAIVIIHRRLQLPYGSVSHSGEPHALVEGQWVPFPRLHSVRRLWTYLYALFNEQKQFFESFTRVDWTFPTELDAWVDEIEINDPRSTFFRYPNPRDTSTDVPKAVMAAGTTDEIIDRLAAGERENKELILLMKNKAGDITHGYYYAGDPQASFKSVLRECTNIFSGLHIALRVEVCGGA